MNPKQVDAALAALFNDAMKRVEAHDSRTDPQGYAALVHAAQNVALALVRNEWRDYPPSQPILAGPLAGSTMPASTLGKEAW